MGQGPAVLGSLGILPTAQPPRIDPQELTLGALIGEGGFGKVPAMRLPNVPAPPEEMLAQNTEAQQVVGQT